MANFLVTTPFNDSFWSKSWHEPLIFAIIFSFYSTKPWKLRGTKFSVDCERELQEGWKKLYWYWRGYSAETFVIYEDIENYAGVYGAEDVIVRPKKRSL